MIGNAKKGSVWGGTKVTAAGMPLVNQAESLSKTNSISKSHKDVRFAAVWGLAVFTLVFGFTLAGCDNGTGGDPDKAAPPVASPAAGAVANGQQITLATATAGASIYYTTDGSTPTTESTLYSSPIAITAATTIKAIATKNGMTDSDVLTAAYTIDNTLVAMPVANPAAGAVQSGTRITLTCGTTGASIYYTTDGSTPTTASTLYSSPIQITAATTIKAIATKSGMTDSSVMTAAYTISAAPAPEGAPAKLASTATAAQAKAKLQEIVNYSGTSAAVKTFAQEGISMWDDEIAPNWNEAKTTTIAMINDMIDHISDPNYNPEDEHDDEDVKPANLPPTADYGEALAKLDEIIEYCETHHGNDSIKQWAEGMKTTTTPEAWDSQSADFITNINGAISNLR
jgi:hypothetical protein